MNVKVRERDGTGKAKSNGAMGDLVGGVKPGIDERGIDLRERDATLT
jgi:hypothetical protein